MLDLLWHLIKGTGNLPSFEKSRQLFQGAAETLIKGAEQNSANLLKFFGGKKFIGRKLEKTGTRLRLETSFLLLSFFLSATLVLLPSLALVSNFVRSLLPFSLTTELHWLFFLIGSVFGAYAIDRFVSKRCLFHKNYKQVALALRIDTLILSSNSDISESGFTEAKKLLQTYFSLPENFANFVLLTRLKLLIFWLVQASTKPPRLSDLYSPSKISESSPYIQPWPALMDIELTSWLCTWDKWIETLKPVSSPEELSCPTSEE